ncbi:MAG: alpha/beta fold hydrolase [Rhodopseudomonas palustris]|nr:alpha/beta fold hydrolase [Rhodopseudomonas palustris]
MPLIDADGCLLNVSVEGRDGAPTLMLSNSLGCRLEMWQPQMKALTQLFRVVRYDRRGHGKSQVTGPYSFERFGRDALAILDDLNIDKVHWCGLSMGGMVGQWLAANAPERIDRLILANTTCYYPDPAPMKNRIPLVRDGGIAAIADTVINNWLTEDFREREPQATANLKAMLLATPVEGYIGCCEALSTLDHRELLPQDRQAHAGDRRAPRQFDAGCLRRIHAQPHPRRVDDTARCRAYFQYRTAARFRRCGDRLPDAALEE